MRPPRTIHCEISEETLARADHLVQIGTLVGAFAHELNNCLQVISGLADLAKDDPGLPPSVARRIHRIIEQASRGTASVRAVLAFARDRSTLIGRTDLAELVSGVLSLRSYPLARLGADVGIERQPGGQFEVIGSPRELEQLILALVLNAEEALADVPGPRRLSVALESDEAMVWLRVSDNGEGMAPSLRESVFEPFTTGFTRGEHAGLGLAAARAIVERFDGQIAAESGPASGTTIVVRLPKA